MERSAISQMINNLYISFTWFFNRYYSLIPDYELLFF